MRKLKVVQVGICHEHANGKYNALKKIPEIFEIAGVVDERPYCHTPHRDEYLYILENEKLLTMEEALNLPGLDAVLIEVPNNDLVRIALPFAQKGIPLHVDKPCGETLAPYKELLDICEKQNLPFQMGYMFRGNPAFKFVIEACRAGLIGDIFDIEGDMNHCYGRENYQAYLGSFPGGIMFNLGCHLIDIIVAILGRPERTFCSLKSAPGDEDAFHNNATAVLDYPHATAVVRACSREVHNTRGRSFRVAGTRGTITFSPLERFDGEVLNVHVKLTHDSGLFKAGSHELHFGPVADRYTGQLTELAQIICKEAKDPFTRAHDLLVHETTLRAAGYMGECS